VSGWILWVGSAVSSSPATLSTSEIRNDVSDNWTKPGVQLEHKEIALGCLNLLLQEVPEVSDYFLRSEL